MGLFSLLPILAVGFSFIGTDAMAGGSAMPSSIWGSAVQMACAALFLTVSLRMIRGARRG